MHEPQRDVLDTFLQALAHRDIDTMMSCYSAEATYHSPIFPHVEGDMLAATWQWFCAKAPDLTLTVKTCTIEGEHAHVEWTATYTFPKTGRPVTQITTSTFTFDALKICCHSDHFDLHAWSRMALGPLGRVFGGRRWLQRSLQHAAAERVKRHKKVTRCDA